MNNGLLPIILVAGLVIFALVRRARGLFSRQIVRPAFLTLRLLIFAALGVVALVFSLVSPPTLLGDLAGLGAGLVAAYFGLRYTVFERQAGGLYFTPNLYIGIGVFVVFLGRLVYRLVEALPAIESAGQQARAGGSVAFSSQFAADPVTGAATFLLVGYYVFYYLALIVRSRESKLVS